LKTLCIAKAKHCDLLRIYWYDGAIASRPTLEQEQLAHLDDVKVRLGFINSAGQQKGVDSLIVTDLIELARLGAIRDAILLSGDEDVRVGVQIAQNYGVRIHLVGIVPSRGSQSKALLQEADTTTEWPATTVANFLSVRAIPATPAAPASPPAAPASGTPATAASDMAKIEVVASDYANNITASDVTNLKAYWATQRGIPPEFDGKLLATCRSVLARDLSFPEKRLLRTKFTDAVKARP
jgi:hypothetical protein